MDRSGLGDPLRRDGIRCLRTFRRDSSEDPRRHHPDRPDPRCMACSLGKHGLAGSPEGLATNSHAELDAPPIRPAQFSGRSTVAVDFITGQVLAGCAVAGSWTGAQHLAYFGDDCISIGLVLDNAPLRRGPFFFTVLALILGPIEAELGTHGAGQWARALLEVSAAWLIGNAALATPTFDSVLLALSLAFAYRGLLYVVSSREVGFALANLSQIVISALLVARGAILNAGFIGIGLVAQVLWQSVARRVDSYDSSYLLRVQWFLLLAMLVAALGVPH
jgi:hypothetical protein